MTCNHDMRHGGYDVFHCAECDSFFIYQILTESSGLEHSNHLNMDCHTERKILKFVKEVKA